MQSSQTTFNQCLQFPSLKARKIVGSLRAGCCLCLFCFYFKAALFQVAKADEQNCRSGLKLLPGGAEQEEVEVRGNCWSSLVCV